MTSNLKPLRGLRVLSLALNLPGPAALMRHAGDAGRMHLSEENFENLDKSENSML